MVEWLCRNCRKILLRGDEYRENTEVLKKPELVVIVSDEFKQLVIDANASGGCAGGRCWSVATWYACWMPLF